MTKRLFNFSAGPANLPEEVLLEAQEQLFNYHGAGMSIMEMSHRSKEFDAVIVSAEERFRRLYKISDDYAVLFLQGGASLQFSMVPANLKIEGKSADIVNTGSWTKKAIKEIAKETDYNVIASSDDKNFSYIPTLDPATFNKDASFFYTCSNNTIFGTQMKEFPNTGNVPLVCDMSSDILSRPLDINKFGLIFAGAQKNIGPSGVTVVIIRKDLAERASDSLPSMLQYRTQISNNSLYNTPPTFGIYIIDLVLKWVENNGGLAGMETKNREKAQLLYDAIDSNPFYYCPTAKDSRSDMNVVFRVTGDREDLEARFVKEATAAGLSGLKGHRSVGGLRASIYNAHPRAGVEALVNFMSDFAKQHEAELTSQAVS